MSFEQTLPNLDGLVLWLIPSDKPASFYQKEIERLSVRYQTTIFSPHLTLGSLVVDTKQYKPEFPGSLFSTFSDHVSLINSHVECRNSPYQNLIHILKSSHDLDMLQFELQKLIKGYQPKKDDYHVSLVYGKFPCRVMDSEIVDLSKRLPEKVTFSKIRAIELGGQPDSWRTLWEQEL